MAHISSSIHVDAPPERVWEVLANVERAPEWQAGTIEVRDIKGSLDEVGGSYTSILKIAGRPLEGHWETTRAERPRLIEFKGTAPGGGRATGSQRLEASGHGTDLTFEIDYELPGGFLGQMANKLFVERQLERDANHSLENLKALCESEVMTAV
jgi:carbon monoxide dehydrogenase subunit G